MLPTVEALAQVRYERWHGPDSYQHIDHLLRQHLLDAAQSILNDVEAARAQTP